MPERGEEVNEGGSLQFWLRMHGLAHEQNAEPSAGLIRAKPGISRLERSHPELNRTAALRR